MKKFTLLLASAAIVSSAVAAEPTKAIVKKADVPEVFSKAQAVKQSQKSIDPANIVKSHFDASAMGASSRAGETLKSRYGLINNLLYNGVTTEFNGYSVAYGVSGVNGSIDFRNYSTGAASYSWEWDNGLKPPYNEDFTSTDENLSVKVPVGDMISAPVLVAKQAQQTDSYQLANTAGYGCGADASAAFQRDDLGMTTYPCAGSATGGIGYMMYDKRGIVDGFNTSTGVYEDWHSVLNQIEGYAEDDTKAIADIQFEGFSTILPAPASPYMMSKMWIWTTYKATAATEVTARLYPVADGIVSSTPIAIGRATIDAGEVKDYMMQFELMPVDEDGDELDEDLVVNQELYVAIEDINSNAAITYMQLLFGAGTVMPANGGKSDEYYHKNASVQMSYSLNGEKRQRILPSPYLYFTSDARDELFVPSNYYWMFDIVYPYVLGENGDVATNFDLSVPNDGGEEAISVLPLYYQLAACVEEGWITAESSEDWFTFDISEPDATTGFSTITVEAEALPEGVEGRVGTIEFHGMAQDFTITVHQGANASINDIVAGGNNAAVEYFDIQGRRLNAAPATGLFFQRQGNTVTKIVK